jgi:hypothetical protein
VITDIIQLKQKKNIYENRDNPQHEEPLTASPVLTVKEGKGPLLTSLYTESVESEH